MTPNTHRWLQIIEASLLQLQEIKVLRSLQAGLAPGQTSIALRGLGLSDSPSLDEMYKWRNGADLTKAGALGDLWIIPGFYHLSLNDAATTYLAMKDDSRWNPAWFPVFANGGGDFYVAELDTKSTSRAVRHYRIEEDEHPIEFCTIDDMIVTIATAFERQIIFSRNGYLDMDYSEFARLAAKLNPDVNWWA